MQCARNPCLASQPVCTIRSIARHEGHALSRRSCTPRLPTAARSPGPRPLGSSSSRLAAASARRRASLLVHAEQGGSSGKKQEPGQEPEEPETAGQRVLRFLEARLPRSVYNELLLMVSLMVSYPATRGTIAVLAGYLLHLDPFGNFHWNNHDAVLGLQCAVPIMLLDALLMLPNYAPKSTKKEIKLKVPKHIAAQIAYTGDIVDAGAAAADPGGLANLGAALVPGGISAAKAQAKEAGEAAGTADEAAQGELKSAKAAVATAMATATAEPPAVGNGTAAAAAVAAAEGAKAGETQEAEEDELVEIERTITVKVPQPPLVAALYRAQLEKALTNVARHLSAPSELLLLLSVHLTEEMLYRAVILALVTGWTIDRLYEAGLDDVVTLAGLQLELPQVGALLATAVCATASLALIVQQRLFPYKVIKATVVKESSRKKAADPKARRRVKRAIAELKRGILEQQRWGTAIEGVRDVVEWGSYSTAYLLTGNLLAPFISAVTTDLAFSAYQRMRQYSLEQEQAQASVMDRIQELRDIVLVAKARSAAREAKGSARPRGKQEGGGGAEAPGGSGGSSREDESGDDPRGSSRDDAL